MARESQRHVKSVIKAMEIIDCFEFHEGLALREINEITSINKSRIIRLCGSLQEMGYLTFNSETNQYALGSRLLCLGKLFESRNTLISVSRPILRKLALDTGESACLFVIDGVYNLCLAREYGNQSIRFVIHEGQRIPLHAGASGKLLLAFSSEELQRHILRERVLIKYTPNTTISPEKLQKELNTILSKEYSLSLGERDRHTAALAVPVHNHEKHVSAALALAGPISRFTLEKSNGKYLKILKEAAQRLSANLGYEK